MPIKKYRFVFISWSFRFERNARQKFHFNCMQRLGCLVRVCVYVCVSLYVYSVWLIGRISRKLAAAAANIIFYDQHKEFYGIFFLRFFSASLYSVHSKCCFGRMPNFGRFNQFNMFSEDMHQLYQLSKQNWFLIIFIWLNSRTQQSTSASCKYILSLSREGSKKNTIE